MQQRTTGAMWPLPGADAFAKRDQPLVDLHPIALWHYGLQRGLRTLRRGCSPAPPTGGDAVDVDVNRDKRPPERDAKGKCGDFRTDSSEGHQALGCVWRHAAEFV